MKLIFPTQPSIINQPFNGNANPTYHNDGLLGHGAIDYAGTYGQNIFAVCDSYIYSDLNFGQAPDRYRAVCTLVDEGDIVYEIIYGHVIDSPFQIKTNVKQGEAIAHMGNFGNVWMGGHQVTNQERLDGSKAGTHLHFQVRKCKRVAKRDYSKHYIKDSNSFVKLQGMFVEILNYDNGYNGCIDPEPFFHIQEPDHIKEAIIELQTQLVLKNFLTIPPGIAPGFFGSLTLEAINKYQTK